VVSLVVAGLSGLTAALAVGYLMGVAPASRRRTGSPKRRTRQWLVEAGLPGGGLAHFWVVSVGAGLAALILLYALSGLWVVAIPPALLVTILPRAYFGRIRERRLAEVRASWPDAVRDVLASIAAGLSLQRALEELARTGPDPLRREFADFPFLARTVGVPAALRSIGERMADPTTDRVVEILVLAHEHGGSVVPEILRDLADATTRDLWALEEIRTQALEHRINARVVFVLPWVVLAAMTARTGAFRDFYASRAGWVVVAVGALMSMTGMAAVARLGRDPVELRVLGMGEHAG
jgi:tight adherence protein B